MAKETFYFSHDYGARNDPKLVKLQMKMGHEGKGIFWDLIEIMYEQGGYINLNECESNAFALRTDCETLNRIINDFDLFKNDGEKFWSESVLSRIKQRNDKSDKARKSATYRWENANAMRTHSDGNAIKESKVKESKVNIKKEIIKEKYVFKVPEISEIEKFIFSNITKIANNEVSDVAAAFFDHHQARGWNLRTGKMKDWKAAVRTWCRNHIKFKNENAKSSATGKPKKFSGLAIEDAINIANYIPNDPPVYGGTKNN